MRRWPGLMLLVCGAAAQAATPDALTLARQADRLYRDGKYAEAARALEEANALEPRPLYLFNIARAYDQANEVDRAVDHYRRYLALPASDTQPELVRRATLALDRLRTAQARAEAERQAQEAERARLERARLDAEARAEREAAAARAQREAFDARQREADASRRGALTGRLVTSVVVAGVGVAALGTSLALAFAASGAKAAFRMETTLPGKRQRESETRTLALLTDVSVLVGVAALITAAALFPYALLAPRGTVSVALVPGPGGAVAVVEASF